METVVQAKTTLMATSEAPVIFPDRIVHFDLKGAPPKRRYILDIFPLLKRLGATGVLMEYEDMFPYSGELQLLRSSNAYSEEDVKTILRAAKINNLKVIPLVQTFGHMEFVLKHDKFSSSREVSGKFQSICPKHPDSLVLLKKMIDQVVAMHRDSSTFLHIGGDEAYDIAKCSRCKSLFNLFGWAKERLTLSHLLRVASYVKQTHNLQVLAWNDMFQATKVKRIAKFRLRDCLQPVVWGYATGLSAKGYFPKGLFHRLSRCFDSVWVASAFKGANGRDQTFIDIDRYVQNHTSWLSLLKDTREKQQMKTVDGIILTGWQRFEHFAPLCELFPVGFPSLAVCLQIIIRGSLNESVYKTALRLLNSHRINTVSAVSLSIDLDQPLSIWCGCDFPGCRVFELVEQLRILKHKISKADTAEATSSLQLIAELRGLGKVLRAELSTIYFEDTVQEWLYQNIQLCINQLKDSNMSAKLEQRTFSASKALQLDF